MSTTSTVVAFRAALIDALEAHATVAADGIQVADGWQGPDTNDEGIYLTDVEGESDLANIGPPRKQRNEEYRQTVVMQSWHAAGSPAEHATAVSRAFAMFAALEDVVAAGPTLGNIQWGRVTSFVLTTVPFETGWAARLTAQVTCTARLT